MKNITKENKKIYKITKPGDYTFYFENKNGDLIFDIQCKNAYVKIYGLYTDDKTSKKFTLNITQKHTVPNSKSTVIIKSILKNESVLKIKSTIHIGKNGTDTDAHFVNKNLLLNNKAQTIISPQLEVLPSNVQCTHATATAPIDKNQLHYLLSRGIPQKKAMRLLIDGFVYDIVHQ